jgi:hypothetical protein
MNHARVWVFAFFSTGCGRPLDLGTDVIWSTDFEEGGFSGLSAAPGTGGFYVSSAGDSSVGISAEHAHSGRYSVKLTSSASLPNPGPEPAGGGGIYKSGIFPQEAYYSAWYYLPQSYITTTAWTILRFPGVRNADAGPDAGLNEVLNLSLESQEDTPQDNTMTLLLGDTNRQYLTSPLAVPPPVVHAGRWFQLEAFYRNAIDSSGHFTVWLDGTRIYDVARPTNAPIGDGGPNPEVYFTPCSLVYQLEPIGDAGPTSAEIYVDDVAISWTRVTPEGVFQVPQ